MRVSCPVLLMFALLSGCQASQPIVQTAQAPKLPSYLRQDLYPQWIDAQAQVRWPPNDGFAAAPTANTVPAGAMIDRFGGDSGTFFSPKGQSFGSRALPYVCEQMVYTVYRVDRPLDVLAGTAAPWFGEPGGTVQYETKEPASKLKEAGTIEVVTADAAGSGKTAARCK